MALQTPFRTFDAHNNNNSISSLQFPAFDNAFATPENPKPKPTIKPARPRSSTAALRLSTAWGFQRMLFAFVRHTRWWDIPVFEDERPDEDSAAPGKAMDGGLDADGSGEVCNDADADAEMQEEWGITVDDEGVVWRLVTQPVNVGDGVDGEDGGLVMKYMGTGRAEAMRRAAAGVLD